MGGATVTEATGGGGGGGGGGAVEGVSVPHDTTRATVEVARNCLTYCRKQS